MQEDLHRRNREVIDGPPTRTPTREKKNDTCVKILIFLITPTTTWQFAAYLRHGNAESRKIFEQKLIFNYEHSTHTE